MSDKQLVDLSGIPGPLGTEDCHESCEWRFMFGDPVWEHDQECKRAIVFLRVDSGTVSP